MACVRRKGGQTERPNSNLAGGVVVGGGEALTEARAQRTSNRRWIPGMSCAGGDEL